MDGKCQTMDVVYDCRVTSSEPQKDNGNSALVLAIMRYQCVLVFVPAFV